MYKHFFKRFFDLTFSIMFFLLFWPLYVVICILVRVKIGGPIYFKQIRPGKNGKLFKMIKFRTMTNEKDADGNFLPDEKRMTKFGEVLRKTSLDELPEIINIFRGEMSLIGPRPQLVKDLVFFSEEVMRRQSIKPGLSGLAQINGRNNIPWETKFEFDLKYIETYSFGTDFIIFFKTIGKAFVSKEDINTDGMATAEDYGDYLLRTGKIDKEEYALKIKESENLISLYKKK